MRNYVLGKDGRPRVEGNNRDQLILEFLPDAMCQTHRYIKNNYARAEDIKSEARLALVKAVDYWLANGEDDNLAKVVMVMVSRAINDYILYDSTIKTPKSNKDKPEIVSATSTNSDVDYYEDFTRPYERAIECDPAGLILRDEFVKAMNLSYKETTILGMRYEGYTQQEIADALVLTQPRVYGIIKEILERFERVTNAQGRETKTTRSRSLSQS